MYIVYLTAPQPQAEDFTEEQSKSLLTKFAAVSAERDNKIKDLTCYINKLQQICNGIYYIIYNSTNLVLT